MTGLSRSNCSSLLQRSGIAQHIAKDPYNFEFLRLAGEVAEPDLESTLTSRITETFEELDP